MKRFATAMVLSALAIGFAACRGPDILTASERQIVLNAPDQTRADKHCSQYGKTAQHAGDAPLRVTYACR
jgi:hypothetical protein